MSEHTLISGPDLAAVQTRRATLHRSCARLRRLLAEPEAGHAAIAAAVADVGHLWERHVQATEAPDGLLAQIVEDAPRLATTVARFRNDHPAIAARITAARLALEPSDELGAAVRQQLLGILGDIDRHRRGGGDLIHRAYNVDIGLGE